MVRRLTGEIYPVGETNEDNKRLENLNIFINLTERMIGDISDIEERYKDAYEYSRKKAAETASRCLDRIGIPKT